MLPPRDPIAKAMLRACFQRVLKLSQRTQYLSDDHMLRNALAKRTHAQTPHWLCGNRQTRRMHKTWSFAHLWLAKERHRAHPCDLVLTSTPPRRSRPSRAQTLFIALNALLERPMPGPCLGITRRYDAMPCHCFVLIERSLLHAKDQSAFVAKKCCLQCFRLLVLCSSTQARCLCKTWSFTHLWLAKGRYRAHPQELVLTSTPPRWS